MSVNSIRANAYTNLGDVWIGYQAALLRQKQVQFGRHFRIEVDAPLDRAAAVARTARSAARTEHEHISTCTEEALAA